MEYLTERIDTDLKIMDNTILTIESLNNSILMDKELIKQNVSSESLIELSMEKYTTAIKQVGLFESYNVSIESLEISVEEKEGLITKIVVGVAKFLKMIWESIKKFFTKLFELLFGRSTSVASQHKQNENFIKNHTIVKQEEEAVKQINEIIKSGKLSESNNSDLPSVSTEDKISLSLSNVTSNINSIINSSAAYLAYRGKLNRDNISDYQEYLEANAVTVVDYSILYGEYLDDFTDTTIEGGIFYNPNKILNDMDDEYLRTMLKQIDQNLFNEIKSKYIEFKIVNILKNKVTIVGIIRKEVSESEHIDSLQTSHHLLNIESCTADDGLVQFLTTKELIDSGINKVCLGIRPYIEHTLPNELKHIELMAESTVMDLNKSHIGFYEKSYLKNSLNKTQWLNLMLAEIKTGTSAIMNTGKILNAVSTTVTSIYFDLVYIQRNK